MARRLLGTAVTDENGEATIEYTGTGAGELHIVAESGTFSSNVITIDDYDPIIDSATITSDKNIIQSGESANLTVIGKDKHNELVNEDTFDLCEQFIVSKVSVDSTGIVQSGSNLDIKAKVNTSLGGVPNKVPVVFKKGEETLDTVQTSASGVATYPYPGTGVGEVNITAECDGVVSETLSVWDCVVYDSCTLADSTKTTFDTLDSDSVFTRYDTYGSLTEATSGTNATLSLSSIPTTATIDFDLCQVDGGISNAVIDIRSGTTYCTAFSLQNLGLSSSNLNTWIPLRLVFADGSATLTHREDSTKTKTNTFSGTANKLRLVTVQTNTEIQLKNLKVYYGE